LFHGRGPSTLFGAAAGAGMGAAKFGYANYAPFQPGERVEIVDGELRPMTY